MRVTRFKFALLATTILGATIGAMPSVNAISLNNHLAPDTAAVADIFDRENTLPSVVYVHACTGTLINARTVLTAAHCFADDNDVFTPVPSELVVKFAPNPGEVDTPHDRRISGALMRGGYAFNSAGNDMTLVSLDRPVTSVLPIPLAGRLDPTPAVGALAIIAGYGQYGTGLDGKLYDGPFDDLAPYDKRRRIGTTRLGAYRSWDVQPGRDPGEYDTLMAQFRDPDSPNDPDSFGLASAGFDVPAGQAGIGRGDSGGPLFLVRADGSLVQIGVLGLAEPSSRGTVGYGLIGGWEYVGNYLDWIATNNPMRVVQARPGEGLWSNAAFWSEGSVPHNVDGGFGQPLGQLGRYYNVMLSDASSVKLDISPTIDSLRVTHPRASLDISPGQRLDVLLDTYLSAGGLLVDGTLQTDLIHQVGGTLSGQGAIIVPRGVHNSQGLVAPGAAGGLGVLTINGDYGQGAGAVLSIRVNAEGSDRLAVAGVSALDGSLLLSPQRTAPAAGQTFTILTAGEVWGDFAQVSSTLPALTWTRTVSGRGVSVTSEVDYVRGLAAAPAIDPAMRMPTESAASTLTRVARRITPADARAAARDTVIGDLQLPSTPALAVAGLNTLGAPDLVRAFSTLPPVGFHGQSAAARQTSRLVSSVLTDRLNVLDGGLALNRGFGVSTSGTVDSISAPLASAFAPRQMATQNTDIDGSLVIMQPKMPRTPFGVFVTGNMIRSGAGAASGYHTYGLTAGLDYRVSPGVTIGAALTYTEDLRTVAGTRHEGRAIAPAVYGRIGSGPFVVNTYIGYAFGQSDTQRFVSYGNRFLSVQASPRYGQFLAGTQAGLQLDGATLSSGWLRPETLTVTPFVGLDVSHASFSRYSERGAGALSVAIDSRSFSEARATAGVEVSWSMPMKVGVMTPRLKAGVTQRFGDSADNATAAFAAAPDLGFGLAGTRESRTYGVFGAALAFQSGDATSALVSYQTDVSRDGLQDSRFSAKVLYRF